MQATQMAAAARHALAAAKAVSRGALTGNKENLAPQGLKRSASQAGLDGPPTQVGKFYQVSCGAGGLHVSCFQGPTELGSDLLESRQVDSNSSNVRGQCLHCNESNRQKHKFQ